MEFTLEYEFSVAPDILYNGWLDSRTHSEMTGGESNIQPTKNKEFLAWDGYISCKNLELVPNQLIKQSWRSSDFKKDQEDSILELQFVSLGNNKTKLILKHSHLTDADMHYKQGWFDSYFIPMAEYFNQ